MNIKLSTCMGIIIFLIGMIIIFSFLLGIVQNSINHNLEPCILQNWTGNITIMFKDSFRSYECSSLKKEYEVTNNITSHLKDCLTSNPFQYLGCGAE